MSAPAPPDVQRHTRRGIALLAAGAGAAALEACSAKPKPSHVPLNRHSPAAGTDLELLTGLLKLERYAIAAYAAGLPLLRGLSADAGKQFLNQELAHESELEGLIRQAGGEPPLRPAFYDLGEPRDSRQVLELLHRVERAQVTAYLDAISRASPPRLRAALAAIVANEAQHAALVRVGLNMAPAPSALVTGRE